MWNYSFSSCIISVLNKKFNCNYTNSVDGCAYYTIDKEGVTNFHIEFLGKPSLGVIVHESVHCVNHIFRSRGVKLDDKKDEISNKIEEQSQKLEYVQGEISDAVKEIQELDDKITEYENGD